MTPVSIQEYVVADGASGPYAITTGPDSALWFTMEVVEETGPDGNDHQCRAASPGTQPVFALGARQPGSPRIVDKAAGPTALLGTHGSDPAGGHRQQHPRQPCIGLSRGHHTHPSYTPPEPPSSWPARIRRP